MPVELQKHNMRNRPEWSTRQSSTKADKHLPPVPHQQPLVVKSMPILSRHRSATSLSNDARPNVPNPASAKPRRDQAGLEVQPDLTPHSQRPTDVAGMLQHTGIRTHASDGSSGHSDTTQQAQPASSSRHFQPKKHSPDDNDGNHHSDDDGDQSDHDRKRKRCKKESDDSKSLLCPYFYAGLSPQCADCRFDNPARLR